VKLNPVELALINNPLRDVLEELSAEFFADIPVLSPCSGASRCIRTSRCSTSPLSDVPSTTRVSGWSRCGRT